MAFYRKLLVAASNIGLKQSSVDPCLYYKWEGGRLVIMISWINKKMIIGPTDFIRNPDSAHPNHNYYSTVISYRSVTIKVIG
jgi:hypothetical protein